MPVGIAEIPRIAAIKGVIRRLDDVRTRVPRGIDRVVDLTAGNDVVADGERRRTDGVLGKPGIGADIILRPDRQFQPAGQLEKRDGAVLELASDDALGRKAKPVAVEDQRPFKIGNAEREIEIRGFMPNPLLWSPAGYRHLTVAEPKLRRLPPMHCFATVRA